LEQGALDLCVILTRLDDNQPPLFDFDDAGLAAAVNPGASGDGILEQL
jgi:hypothetical protein